MTVQPHELFYKGKEASFFIFVDDAALLQKYRKGDTTIPMVDLVSVFKIFVNRQGGVEGKLDEASKAELANEFGNLSSDEIIRKILIEGEDKKLYKVANHGDPEI